MSSDAPANTDAEDIQANGESDSDQADASQGRFAFLSTLTIFDGMLIVSLVSITMACLLLFIELGRFGGYGGWNTTEAQVGEIELPS